MKGRVCTPLIVLSIGCSLATSPTSTGSKFSEEETVWWNEVISDIEREQKVDGFPFKPPIDGYKEIPTHVFNVRARDGQFKCGKVEEAWGCFTHGSGTPTINYVAGMRGAFRHEAVHAILWYLKDSRMSCAMHDNNRNLQWDCYE